MSQVSRYVIRQTGIALLAATVICTLIIWLVFSLRFLDYIVNHGISFDLFLYLTVLLLPRFLAFVMPIALFGAVIFVYQRLATDSELVVLRATGLSDMRLARPAILLATAVAIGVGALNLYLTPAAARAFKELQYAIRNDYASLLIQPGVFRTINDMTIFVREQYGTSEFGGILIHDDSDPRKRVTWMAERGALMVTEHGPRAVLINGNRQEIDRDKGRLSLLYFDRNTVDLGILSREASNRFRDVQERSLEELFSASAEDVGENNVGKFRAEGHQRIVEMFYPFGFVLLAVAALTFGDFNRRGYLWRIVGAVGAFALMLGIGLGSKAVAGKAPPLVVLMYLNAFLPIAGCLYLLVRQPRRRRPAAPPPDEARAPPVPA